VDIISFAVGLSLLSILLIATVVGQEGIHTSTPTPSVRTRRRFGRAKLSNHHPLRRWK
jgi:hypothetical protein